jgi:L-alanine-DL-glutamate epimerase-like enolase superfamily enzyme
MKKPNRRLFLTTALTSSAALSLMSSASSNEKDELISRFELLDKVLKQPILKKHLFTAPVVIKSVELLEFNGSYLCRVRSEDGAEGLSVAHPSMPMLYPIFLNAVQPFFIGQDTRELDILVEKIYTFRSNFRFNGLAIGLPLATIEFAILDMLGKMVNKPMAELIGEIRNPEINLYYATELRGLPLEEHFARIKAETARFDINALKIRVGYQTGTKDIHYGGVPGKSEKLGPMVREHYGDNFALYADANGYYDVAGAVKMGRLLEEYKYGYFEEPVLYWHFEETKQVSDALTIPIAHGEQDQSYYNFRWLLAHDGIGIVEPDTYYTGGFIRSMRVALMGQAVGKPCVTHMSGGGLGFLYNALFVSALPNPFEHHEFKTFDTNIPYECPTAPMKVVGGKMKVPTGPGLGVIVDPEFVAKHKPAS